MPSRSDRSARSDRLLFLDAPSLLIVPCIFRRSARPRLDRVVSYFRPGDEVGFFDYRKVAAREREGSRLRIRTERDGRDKFRRDIF